MKRILFVTSCRDVWGGSEELWSGAALELKRRGLRVFAGRSAPWHSGPMHPRWVRLRDAGIRLRDFGASRTARLIPDVLEHSVPIALRPAWRVRNLALAAKLALTKADLVVISQGGCYDGLFPVCLPEVCRFAGVPYVVVAQKAAEIDWPGDGLRHIYRRCYGEAAATFFVSRHNRTTAEQQLAMRLPRVEIVRNPFMVSGKVPQAWPSTRDGVMRLACVARLLPLEKAQDLLLRVLARETWRKRAVEVSFFGEGPMRRALEEMAQFLGLSNVHFRGFAETNEIWRTHHALVLPSRSEGLPLAQVEAMMCGRPVIVTDAGGSGEIMQDGIHGFLATGPSEHELGDAMERAWESRNNWRTMGEAAGAHIRKVYPENPCAVFADRLEDFCLSPNARRDVQPA